MTGLIRIKLEMFARVRTFSRAHPSTDPEYTTVLGRLDENLTRAEGIAARQFDGVAAAKSARLRRRELRKVLHFQLLRYLVAVGEVAAKTRAELAERFKLPEGHATNLGFLTSAKSMLAMAEAQKEALVSEGMSPRLLDDIGRMVAEFESAIEATRVNRLSHIGARADLKGIAAEMMDQVVVLDGINRWRFGSAPELMAEWNAAKHLPATRVRVSRSPVVEGNGEASPGTGGVAPAA